MSDLLDKHSEDYDPERFLEIADDQRKRDKESGVEWDEFAVGIFDKTRRIKWNVPVRVRKDAPPEAVGLIVRQALASARKPAQL